MSGAVHIQCAKRLLALEDSAVRVVLRIFFGGITVCLSHWYRSDIAGDTLLDVKIVAYSLCRAEVLWTYRKYWTTGRGEDFSCPLPLCWLLSQTELFNWWNESGFAIWNNSKAYCRGILEVMGLIDISPPEGFVNGDWWESIKLLSPSVL